MDGFSEVDEIRSKNQLSLILEVFGKRYTFLNTFRRVDGFRQWMKFDQKKLF